MQKIKFTPQDITGDYPGLTIGNIYDIIAIKKDVRRLTILNDYNELVDFFESSIGNSDSDIHPFIDATAEYRVKLIDNILHS